MRTIPGRIVMALALAVAGCAGVEDHSAFVEDYERSFAARHEHRVHSVPRGPHVLHAREFGAEHAGELPSIVLLHGFPDSLHLYDGMAPLLGATRHTVAFDFLGWGGSEKPQGHSYDGASLQRDLEAVLAHFELGSVVLVAHDASGLPVIDWSLEHPERVAGIVLLNTVYAPSESLVRPEAIERYSAPGFVRDLQVWGAMRSDTRFQAGFEEQVGKFFCDDEQRETYLKIFSHQSFAIRPAFFGLNRVLREEVAARAERLPEMRRFDRPVLIVFGADDRYLNADVAREFHAIFPNSALHLIDGACHYVQLDRPRRVAEFILAAPMI